MFFLLLLGVLEVISAPVDVMVSTPATGMTCGMPMNITIGTGMPWNFPTTMIAPNQFCQWNFFVSGDDFLITNFTAFNIGMKDYIFFYGDWDTNYGSIEGDDCQSFQYNMAWANRVVSLTVYTGPLTMMNIAFNVIAKTANPKFVGSYITDTNKPASFLYLNGWKEGAAYNFTSKTGRVAVSAAALYSTGLLDEWSNIFVYEKGILLGSIYDLARDAPYISKSSTITLFMAKQPNLIGALQVTDYSNIAQFASYAVEFAPIGSLGQTFSIFGNAPGGGAKTIIGYHDGSSPITITQVQSQGGTFSYLVGGPQADHHLATPLIASKLPQHLTGNAWTIYIDGLYGFVSITSP